MKRTKYEAIPTARFWVYHAGGWVKISLRYGQSVRHGRAWDNGEGTSWEENTYLYDSEQGRPLIFNEWASGGSDCDGVLRRNGCLFCTYENLGAKLSYNGEAHTPIWEKYKEERVFDLYAQMAGY